MHGSIVSHSACGHSAKILGPFLNVYLLFSSFIKLIAGESATTSANTEKIILNLYLAYIYACTCSWS